MGGGKSADRQEIGGRGSGDGQVRGLMARRTEDYDWRQDDRHKLPRQEPVLFSMPNKDPELARKRKHECYMQNSETILRRKQQCPAEKKKQQTPMEEVRARNGQRY